MSVEEFPQGFHILLVPLVHLRHKKVTESQVSSPRCSPAASWALEASEAPRPGPRRSGAEGKRSSDQSQHAFPGPTSAFRCRRGSSGHHLGVFSPQKKKVNAEAKTRTASPRSKRLESLYRSASRSRAVHPVPKRVATDSGAHLGADQSRSFSKPPSVKYLRHRTSTPQGRCSNRRARFAFSEGIPRQLRKLRNLCRDVSGSDTGCNL